MSLQLAPTPAPRQTDMFQVRTCRLCGCTDRRACSAGCSWVGPNICSACAFGDGREHDDGEGVTWRGARTALVIRLGGRFFSGVKNGRLGSAWSLAGAALFLPGRGDLVLAAVKRIRRRRPRAAWSIVAVDLDTRDA